MTPRSFSMRLPGLPANDNATRRKHWASKGEEAAVWRRDAAWMARAKAGGRVAPFPRARITLRFTFAQDRRQGLDAYVGACKPIIDGLVDAGLIEDDGFAVVPELRAEGVLGTANHVDIMLEELA